MPKESKATSSTVALAPGELRYLVLAAQREGNRFLTRQLANADLTASQAEVLLVLDEYGPVTLKELGSLIVCETGSPSRIVDTLVKRGLVERDVNPSDRRAVSIRLSSEGQGFVPMLQTLDKQVDAGAHESFSRAEMAGLVSSLRKYLAGTVSETVLEQRFVDKRKPLS